MPANVSRARASRSPQAFGTELIFSRPDGGLGRRDPPGAASSSTQIPDKYFYPDQYSNPVEPARPLPGHRARDPGADGGRVTHFVTGIGTSGTVMGTGPPPEGVPPRHRGLRGRARRRAPRARGPQAHGQLDRAGNLPPRGARRRAADAHRRSVGRVRAARPRRMGCSSAIPRARRWRARWIAKRGRRGQARRDRHPAPRSRRSLLRGARCRTQTRREEKSDELERRVARPHPS